LLNGFFDKISKANLIMHLRFRAFIWALLLLLFFAPHAQLHADNTIIAPLNFGKIIIADNKAISSLKILPDGGCYVNGNILIIEECSPAEIYFYNFPPNTQLYFTTTISNEDIQSADTGSAKFRLSEVTSEQHKVTNENGEVTLYIGGTLTTTGVGNGYRDSSYQGHYRVSVNYY